MMETLKELLNNYIIYKEHDEEKFYRIKDSYFHYKKFIEENLKYRLIQRPDFLKLEKLPGTPHSSMGIQEFTSLQDYVIFLKLLYFLDNREKGNQFLFSDLKNSMGINWLEGKNRMSLTRVLKFALEIPIIRQIELQEEGEEREALLESLGNSRYLISSSYVHGYSEEIDLKTKVYRDLVMNNVSYSDQEDVYEYCKIHREEIDRDLNEFLNWNLQIHKNMVLPVIGEVSNIFKSFPGKADEDRICLQFNSLIRQKILEEKFKLALDDTLTLKSYEVDELIEELRDKNQERWTKLSREKKNQNLKKDILEVLEFFSFIKKKENEIKIYPLCGKLVGEYGEE